MSEAALIWLAGILGGAIISVLINDPLKFVLARLVGGYDPREQSLRGLWKARYDYPSQGARRVEEHYFIVKQVGDYVVARTLTDGQARYKLRGKLDGLRFWTGTWEERTPDGRFYHGAFQLAIRPHRKELHGKWLGFNRDDVVMEGSWDWVLEKRNPTRGDRERYAKTSGWSSGPGAELPASQGGGQPHASTGRPASPSAR